MQNLHFFFIECHKNCAYYFIQLVFGVIVFSDKLSCNIPNNIITFMFVCVSYFNYVVAKINIMYSVFFTSETSWFGFSDTKMAIFKDKTFFVMFCFFLSWFKKKFNYISKKSVIWEMCKSITCS